VKEKGQGGQSVI